MATLQPFGRRHSELGAVTVEWLLAAPIVLLLGLGALQWSLVFQARSALAFAVQQAAREGALDHAQPSAIEQGLARGLIPFWGIAAPGRPLDLATPAAQARLALESAQGVLVWRQISPSRESFSDWAQPSRDADGALVAGRLEIPNEGLAHADRRVGAMSGQSLRDANLLKLELRYGVPLQVPLIGPMAVRIMEAIDGCSPGTTPHRASAATAFTPANVNAATAMPAWTCAVYRAPGVSGVPVGRWPVQLVATTRMQSAAWPSGQTPFRKEQPGSAAVGQAGGAGSENRSGSGGAEGSGAASPGNGAGSQSAGSTRPDATSTSTSTGSNPGNGSTTPGPADSPAGSPEATSSAEARQLSQAILARGPLNGSACAP